MGRPKTVGSPRDYAKSTIYFDKMIAYSLWIPRGKSNKLQQQYFPALRCVGALSDVYRPQRDHEEITLPEKINKVALERYASSQTRWGGRCSSDGAFTSLFLNQAVGKNNRGGEMSPIRTHQAK